MDKNELLKQIMAIGLSAFDLHLYLNSHPYDQQALIMYANFINQGNILKNQYQMQYGPLTASFAANQCPWSWINSPWPWENQ